VTATSVGSNACSDSNMSVGSNACSDSNMSVGSNTCSDSNMLRMVHESVRWYLWGKVMFNQSDAICRAR